MTSVDEKLDRIVEAVQQVNVNLESLRVSMTLVIQVTKDHESRIRTIERWQNKLTPVLAVLTFMLGSVFTELLDRLM